MPKKTITPKEREALIKERVEKSLGALRPEEAGDAVDSQLKEDGITVADN